QRINVHPLGLWTLSHRSLPPVTGNREYAGLPLQSPTRPLKPVAPASDHNWCCCTRYSCLRRHGAWLAVPPHRQVAREPRSLHRGAAERWRALRKARRRRPELVQKTAFAPSYTSACILATTPSPRSARTNRAKKTYHRAKGLSIGEVPKLAKCLRR